MSTENKGNVRLFIQVVLAILMGIGAWFAKRVDDGVEQARRDINDLRVTMAGVMSAKVSREEFESKTEKMAARMDQMNSLIMSKLGIKTSGE